MWEQFRSQIKLGEKFITETLEVAAADVLVLVDQVSKHMSCLPTPWVGVSTYVQGTGRERGVVNSNFWADEKIKEARKWGSRKHKGNASGRRPNARVAGRWNDSY